MRPLIGLDSASLVEPWGFFTRVAMRFGYVGFGIYINLADAWRDVAVLVVSQSPWAIGNGIWGAYEYLYESWR